MSRVYRAFRDSRARGSWPGDVKLTIRTAIPNKSMRVTWPDGTSVEWYFVPRGPAKCQVAVQHVKLADRAAMDRMKAYWSERLDDLGRLLASPAGSRRRPVRAAAARASQRPASSRETASPAVAYWNAMRKLLLWMGAGAGAALCAVWLVAWRSPPFYDAPPVAFQAPILTMAQYDSVSQFHPRPYLVKVESAAGAVLLFGASHTRDPHDPQIETLRREWEAFRPTVALVEGRLGFLLPGLMDPVEAYGEMGAAAALARAGDVRLYSWEPRREVEIQRMLDSFPAERVALFYVLRPYFSQIRFGRPEDPESFVEEFRRKRTGYPGLEGTLPSIAAIDSLWARDFVGLPDWRETSDEYGLPGYLADLSSRSNALRDEHLAGVIVDLVRRGERVFAIAGSSHAVKLDSALHAALGGRKAAGL